jgi:hypothetical protein
MNFRTWLEHIEEATAPPRADVSQGIKRGPEGSYGARALLPLDFTLNNRAVASVIGGMGEANAKIRARMGAKPGNVPQFDRLDDMRRSGHKSVYMPLQLPAEWNGQQFSLNTRLVTMASTFAPNPLQSPKIWNCQGATQIDRAGEGDKLTTLYSFKRSEGQKANINAYNSARAFTQALMQASLAAQLSNQSHLIDIQRPSITHVQEFPVAVQGDSNPEDPQFNIILMCSFQFNPKNKDANVGYDTWSDFNNTLDTSKSNTQGGQNSGARRPGRRSAARGAASVRPAVPPNLRARPNGASQGQQTGPVTT